MFIFVAEKFYFEDFCRLVIRAWWNWCLLIHVCWCVLVHVCWCVLMHVCWCVWLCWCALICDSRIYRIIYLYAIVWFVYMLGMIFVCVEDWFVSILRTNLCTYMLVLKTELCICWAPDSIWSRVLHQKCYKPPVNQYSYNSCVHL